MKSKFIIFVVIVVLFVAGLGIFANRSQNAPSKYTDFAKALVNQGTHFYGAFWCPHCADQEKALGITRQNLESMGLYTECSNADRSPTQICLDKKIESFPTWMFKNGITINSASDPTVCQIASNPDVLKGEPPVCAQVSSDFFKVFVFPNYQFSVRSPVDPTHKGDVWQFPSEASTAGELPLDFIASQIGYTIPK